MTGGIEIRIAATEERHGLDAMLHDMEEPEDYVPEVIGDWLAQESVFIAFINGVVAGMSHFEYMPDGGVWLSGLRVAKSLRKSGVGSALTRFAVNMPGRTVFRLAISSINSASISISEKAGFRRRCVVSLWRAPGVSAGLAELRPAECGVDEMEYTDLFDGLLPTTYLAFDPGTADREKMRSEGLSFVSDRRGSIFLLNNGAEALTPVHLEDRASFSSIPPGYILVAGEQEKLDAIGLEQSLWTKSLGIYEYRRND